MFLKEYEKLRLIGKGAFASVYKVRHLNLGYVRALKVSHEIIEDESDKSWQTFLNECRMLLRIGNGAHPNIVRIYQPRLLENKAAVEMDYVDGLPLSEYVEKTGFISIEEFKTFACQIVGALAYCHVDIYQFMMDADSDDLQSDPQDGRKFLISPEKRLELIEKYGVIHNDLHSNNIIRRHYDGQYILLDFGLAIQDDHCVKSSSRGDGAIEYTAPEKLEQNLVSKQSDVYSLGILLYEMLAGRVPFQCKGVTPESARAKVYMQHLTETPPSIEPFRQQAFEAANPGEEYRDDLPEGLTDIVMKCLSKDPEDRYADAKELSDALKECFYNNKHIFVPEAHRDHVCVDDLRRELDLLEKRVKLGMEDLALRLLSKIEDIKVPFEFVKNTTSEVHDVSPQDFVHSVEEQMHTESLNLQIFQHLMYTDLVKVQGGTFTMGATEEQGQRDPYGDESPMHIVELSDYYIGKYLVTQELWEFVMKYSGRCDDGSIMHPYSVNPWLGEDPSDEYGIGEHFPAYNVSYDDIVNIFLPRLNRITGKEFRLPTEAEWEYAARGGCNTNGYKYSGSHNLNTVGWCEDNAGDGSRPVGQKTSNELGIYDMSGNVFEWCSDWFGKYGPNRQINPLGSIVGSYRVIRGGHWRSEQRCCRLSYRSSSVSTNRSVGVGFRLACSQF